MITAIEEEEEDYQLPSYSTPGRILVAVHGPGVTGAFRYEVEVLDYDADSSVFWIKEGEGFEFWLESVDEIEPPGLYVIEGIRGDYVRGDGWMTDDDVDWQYDSVRPATKDEAVSGSLSD